MRRADLMKATVEFPHLRAMLARLRIEMTSAAQALQGDLLVEFWTIVDDLNVIRTAKRRTIG